MFIDISRIRDLHVVELDREGMRVMGGVCRAYIAVLRVIVQAGDSPWVRSVELIPRYLCVSIMA